MNELDYELLLDKIERLQPYIPGRIADVRDPIAEHVLNDIDEIMSYMYAMIVMLHDEVCVLKEKIRRRNEEGE